MVFESEPEQALYVSLIIFIYLFPKVNGFRELPDNFLGLKQFFIIPSEVIEKKQKSLYVPGLTEDDYLIMFPPNHKVDVSIRRMRITDFSNIIRSHKYLSYCSEMKMDYIWTMII